MLRSNLSSYWGSVQERMVGLTARFLSVPGRTKAINLRVLGTEPPSYAPLFKTSSNSIFNWLITKSQLAYVLVHFLLTFSVTKYSIFNRLSSLGNINFVFVTFLNWLCKLSMQFVVYIIFLIKSKHQGRFETTEKVVFFLAFMIYFLHLWFINLKIQKLPWK